MFSANRCCGIFEAYLDQEDAMGESFYLFSLPDDEYWDMKFAKRINPEGSQSPPSMPHLISGPSLEDIRAVRRHSTVEDTDGKSAASLR